MKCNNLFCCQNLVAVCVLLGCKLPVDEFVQENLHEIGTAELVIEVVGVLPDIAGEDWVLVRGHEWGLRSRSGDDLELLGFRVEGEPHPAGAKHAECLSFELGCEGIVRAKALVDRVAQVTGGSPAASRLHAAPEKCVVPNLRRRVEKTGVVLALGFLHDVHNVLSVQAVGALHFGDVGLVVAPMMALQGVLADVWLQRIVRVR
mmetsp:Transcript_15557/g.33787  ORF Transcript_15557/g.33787 Transcript_15557/m.33787 type:complete len:204 (+) Transcript_15557:12-623(+)